MVTITIYLLSFQIQFGRLQPTTNGEIKVDDMVLVNVQKYLPEWPQIGKILHIDGNHVTIQRWSGTMSGAWKIHKVRERREMLPTEEEISKEDIIYNGFRLTKANYIPKKIQDIAKEYASFIFE